MSNHPSTPAEIASRVSTGAPSRIDTATSDRRAR
jgi:hypothetical protein